MMHLLTPQDHFVAQGTILEMIIRLFLLAIENNPINPKAISRNMGMPEITQQQFVEGIKNAYSL